MMKYRISRSKTNRTVLRHLGIPFQEKRDGIYFIGSLDDLPRVEEALKELGIAYDEQDARKLAWSFFVRPVEGSER
jgi:microsomal dipeptidase-like Zn-dependent dipeptidase